MTSYAHGYVQRPFTKSTRQPTAQHEAFYPVLHGAQLRHVPGYTGFTPGVKVCIIFNFVM